MPGPGEGSSGLKAQLIEFASYFKAPGLSSEMPRVPGAAVVAVTLSSHRDDGSCGLQVLIPRFRSTVAKKPKLWVGAQGGACFQGSEGHSVFSFGWVKASPSLWLTCECACTQLTPCQTHT